MGPMGVTTRAPGLTGETVWQQDRATAMDSQKKSV